MGWPGKAPANWQAGGAPERHWEGRSLVCTQFVGKLSDGCGLWGKWGRSPEPCAYCRVLGGGLLVAEVGGATEAEGCRVTSSAL